MKKEIKFRKGLSLNKETLSKMNDQQMKAIAGGRNQGPSQQGTTPTVVGGGGLASSDCCSYVASACC